MWAQVRLRNGKIALFAIGYLLVCLAVAALALGGLGAALASIRLGKAELVARFVLTGLSSIAIIGAVVLGIGVNPAFSNAALRRYPLSDMDRFFVRRITAFLDPLWILLLAAALGLAAGFAALGAGSIWLGVPCAVLLTIGAYLTAQLLSRLIEWLLSTPAGALILVLALMLLFAGIPAAQAMKSNAQVLHALRFTPAFASAAAMAGGWIAGLPLLAAWCLALLGAVAAAERLPARSRNTAPAAAEWDDSIDRLAARFGPSAPLIGKTLKYYWRTNRTRIGALINVPAFVLMVAMLGRDKHYPLLGFFVAMGVMSVVGYSTTWMMSINCFGFDGSGFRRYFVLPLSPASVMRIMNLVPLAMGAAVVPLAFAGCVLLSRTALTAQMVVMLLSNGIGGLFFYQALAIWVSLLAPRRADPQRIFGNDYSKAANLIGNIGMLIPVFGSQGLGMAVGARVLAFWWLAPAFMLLSVCFYAVTLGKAPAVLLARRERILAIVEQQESTGRLIT